MSNIQIWKRRKDRCTTPQLYEASNKYVTDTTLKIPSVSFSTIENSLTHLPHRPQFEPVKENESPCRKPKCCQKNTILL